MFKIQQDLTTDCGVKLPLSIFDWIFFILACYDMHERLYEIEFPVTMELPLSTLAPSFLIGSSSYLQVTRTSIISRTSSNFSQFRPWTAELAALELLKKFP